MLKSKPVILLFSGGLDSTVLLYDLLKQNCDVHCVLFNYGQKHANRELSAAQSILLSLNHGFTVKVGWTEIELPEIRGSSITDGGGSKVVPNRNAIMLSTAIALAMNAKSEAVIIGCNKDDAADFPDCRREFIEAINVASKSAGTGIEVCAPYLDMTKKQIVQIGRRLNAPLGRTWSCYSGGFEPCGKCDACQKRSEAVKSE